MGLLGLQNGCRTKKVCRHSFFTLFCTFTFTFFFIFPFFWKSHLNFAFCLWWGAVALRLYWETPTEGGAGCGESSELKRRRQVENTELMHVSIVCKLDIACAAQMLNASELKKTVFSVPTNQLKVMQFMQVSMFSKFLCCGQDISKQPVARKWCRDDKALQIRNAQDETCLWLFQGRHGGMTKIYSIRNTQDETVRSTVTLSRSPSLDVRCCATCLSLTFGI